MQGELHLSPASSAEVAIGPFAGTCALEEDTFPFDVISDVAEAESWRKEINRPIYHIHKWWARRLGTVFRAIIIGALTPSGTNILSSFYQRMRLTDRVIFDPFMGSGTTLGEALKLGARVIGYDINPVAHFIVRNALSVHDRRAIFEEFQEIRDDISEELKSYYKADLGDGNLVDVLYFFWVKEIDCPKCENRVDLFSSRVFARHAYPERHPLSQAICPSCGEVNPVAYDALEATCSSCLSVFNPQTGPARRQKATCPSCEHCFQIAKTIRASDAPPSHRLYAKLVLLPNGEKRYLAATERDMELYDRASIKLADRVGAYPVVAIEPGYNTDQVMGYNYQYWHEMFNDRQLLCLSVLAERIRMVNDIEVRNLFTCLFSGALEFNNLFASYKGEGTGAVRHMFAHHILKPERVPLEANVWGTPKSSGSFSTLFEGRIRRALDYADKPFELRPANESGRKSNEKVYGLSEPIGFKVVGDYGAFEKGSRVQLSCGDSSRTDLVSRSVDAVITDPPFFDNVHYSQLADFFHIWQRHILGHDGPRRAESTRSSGEVQSADVGAFTGRLASVWSEACRVLSDDGVLAFTYHHSRSEGWRSVLHALMVAGFGITAAHPVKAEMSVGVPKFQAKHPIDLDIVLVCRKRSTSPSRDWLGQLQNTVLPVASWQIGRLRARGRRLSRNDVQIVVMAQLIRRLSWSRTLKEALSLMEQSRPEVDSFVRSVGDGHDYRADRGKS